MFSFLIKAIEKRGGQQDSDYKTDYPEQVEEMQRGLQIFTEKERNAGYSSYEHDGSGNIKDQEPWVVHV